jgi:hypothetical protein
VEPATDAIRARQGRLRHGLLTVLLCDATAVALLGAVAVVTRCRPSGAAYAAIARVATASLIPGIAAVALEQRAHRPFSPGRHRMRDSVVLLATGLIINTIGTSAVLRRSGPPRPGRGLVTAVDLALLVGGDLIGVPYLTLVRALHRAAPRPGH